MSETVTCERLPLSRREREREARRREILDAAIRLFAEKGFEQTTLDEIAQKAEFGKGTIYHYFKNKEELIITYLQEGVEYFIKLGKNSAQMPNLSASQKLKHYAHHMTKFVRENEHFVRVMVFELLRIVKMESEDSCGLYCRRQELNEIIAGIIESGIADGEFKPLSPIGMAELFLNLFRIQNFTNIIEKREPLSDEDLKLIETIFFDGLSTK